MAKAGAAATVLWFRRDLRLADNPALQWAIERGGPVIPLYVRDEHLETRPMGAAARWWLDKSLKALAADLEARGSRLVLRAGPAPFVVHALMEEAGADALAFSDLLAASDATEEAERPDGAEVGRFSASWLTRPGSLRTGQGGAYKVFAPYGRALREAYAAPPPTPAPKSIPAPAAWPESEKLSEWGLHPTRPDWSTGFADWEPGEAGAVRRLEAFVDDPLAGYVKGRDTPGVEGTTRLSPHLAFGEIAPWRIESTIREAAARKPALMEPAEKAFNELAWRDFAAHLLRAFPQMRERNMRGEFDHMPWRRDPRGFRAWTRGQTGYPIVDAGMRQLWKTGWMHNRVRMAVASFLVKDLLIDWREGEAWFWDTLVDADPGANATNWQWAAGSGVDASPFFRIFNPTSQGERFDKDGAYVRRWVPELARLPARWLHRPWQAPREVLAAAGVELGRNYPAPIVDHAEARDRALAAYRGLK